MSRRPSARKGGAGFDGYIVDQDSSIAVRAGEAELLTADEAHREFGVQGATSAFCVQVAPGTQKEVTFYIVQYRAGILSELAKQPLRLMSAALYANISDVLTTAEAEMPAAVARCEALDRQLATCGQDEERRFLAADALHSYQFNTLLYATEHQEPEWAVIEGECNCINTFDLTVDHVFYELTMHPWTVRNELDNFLDSFSYTDELFLRDHPGTFSGGLGFSHDMGSRLQFSNREQGAVYTTLMTQEELQNWILCAALYWKRTGDNAWLERNRGVFIQALNSMERRDDVRSEKTGRNHHL